MHDWNRDGKLDGKELFDYLGGDVYAYEEIEKERKQMQDRNVYVQKEQKVEVKNDKKGPTAMINDLSEADMEYLISKYPEHFIEKGLSLSGSQMAFGENRIDLLFKDVRGAYLIVEIQKGLLDRKHLYRMLDYHDDLKIKYPNECIELMIVANEIRGERKEKLKNHDIEYKEIQMSAFIKFAETHDEVMNLPSTKMGTGNQYVNTDDYTKDLHDVFEDDEEEIFATDVEILTAVMMDEFEKAELLIQQGHDVNGHDDDKSTALHKAIRESKIKFIKLLVENGADVNAMNINCETPFTIAITEDKDKIAEYLKRHGGDINFTDRKGKSLLYYRILVSDFTSAIKLLKWGANPNAYNRRDGNTLLHDVIFLAHVDLKFSSSDECFEIVKMLVKHGADVNAKAKNDDMETPLSLACRGNIITGSKNYRIVKLLLENGGNVETIKKEGQSLLTDAINAEDTELINLLYLHGVDVNKIDNEGLSPIQTAIKWHSSPNHNIIRLLAKYGANLNVRDQEGKPLLFEAVEKENIDAIKLYFECGAKPNFKEKEGGLAPLHGAAIMGNVEIIEMLLQHGADINIKSNEMQTPLHCAVLQSATFSYRSRVSSKKHNDAIILLLNNGADMYAKTNEYETPIDIAKNMNNQEIMAIFARHNIKKLWPFGKKKK